MKDNRKVKCTKCGAELGYQGLSRHMWFKHQVGKRYPNKHMKTAKVVPGEHPVEELEGLIHKLVQRETALREELDRMSEITYELQSIAQLRESLEKMVEVYRQRKEQLTGVSA